MEKDAIQPSPSTLSLALLNDPQFMADYEKVHLF